MEVEVDSAVDVEAVVDWEAAVVDAAMETAVETGKVVGWVAV